MKKLGFAVITAVIFCMLLAGCLTDAVQSDNPDESYAHGSMIETTYNGLEYWLYIPQKINNDMPLIVYLHGGSGKGDDPSLIMKSEGLPKYLYEGTVHIDSYVLVPQLKDDYKNWQNISDKIIQLIELCVKEYGINKNRISITGHSMGGTGTWFFALSYPNVFSAAVPLSGSVKLTEANLRKLMNMPIWAIVGNNDTIVPPRYSTEFIARLQQINSNAKVTVLEGYDHFDVAAIYLDKDLNVIEWLISQSRM